MRLSPASLSRLREAADLRAQDVTSFVLWTALDRAADIVALERRTRPAPATPDLPDPEPIVRDPDDPDDDLWDDRRVAREPLDLQRAVFAGLKAQRADQRRRDLEREARAHEEQRSRERDLAPQEGERDLVPQEGEQDLVPRAREAW